MTKGTDTSIFVTEAAGQVYKQTATFVYLGVTVCEDVDLLSRSTGACYWPICVSGVMAYHCTTSPPHRSGSKYGCSTPRSWKPCCTDVSRGAPPWPVSPYCARLTTDWPSAASDGRGRRHGYHMLSYAYALGLAVKKSRRRRENGGYFSRGSRLVQYG